MNKLEIANEVLKDFSCVQLEKLKGGMYVSWNIKKPIRRRWQCRGQDFYPVWHNIYPGGGTSSMALAQLIRWCQDKPVLPLTSWRWWSGESVALVSKEAVDKLESACYPKVVKCVLCRNDIVGSMDWWSLNKVSGPCCSHLSGCRQRIRYETVN